MSDVYRIRRAVLLTAIMIFLVGSLYGLSRIERVSPNKPANGGLTLAIDYLEKLSVRVLDSKDGYSRNKFGGGWTSTNGCDTRNLILYRDLEKTVVDEQCHVISGILIDPYTASTIQFIRGTNSADVQIDHVVALSNAWQTGAQQLSDTERISFANDPLELLAVSGKANQQKSDGDASVWLPPNKAYRCTYVARQIAVKFKYHLWASLEEKNAIKSVLSICKSQALPAS